MRLCPKEEKRETIKEEMAKAGPGLIEPDMELFCKAAADGASLGDCPFTQYIQVGARASGREAGGRGGGGGYLGALGRGCECVMWGVSCVSCFFYNVLCFRVWVCFVIFLGVFHVRVCFRVFCIVCARYVCMCVFRFCVRFHEADPIPCVER